MAIESAQSSSLFQDAAYSFLVGFIEIDPIKSVEYMIKAAELDGNDELFLIDQLLYMERDDSEAILLAKKWYKGKDVDFPIKEEAYIEDTNYGYDDTDFDHVHADNWAFR